MSPHIFRTTSVPTAQFNRTYDGPVTPTAYDQNWQLYTNLTKDQIVAFQAFPEWATFVASQPAVQFSQAQLNPPIKGIKKTTHL